MAKLTILAYCHQMNLSGVRFLSSYIKDRGHDCQIIYMVTPWTYLDVFSKALDDQVIEACRKSDLIGLSVTSSFHLEAARMTKLLKGLDKPVLWGGIHPTVAPDECMNDVDIIARGDVEKPLYDLLMAISNNKDISDIPSLWVRTISTSGETFIKKNDLQPLVSDLDDLGMPDIDYESHLIAFDNTLKPIDTDMMKKHMLSDDGKRVDYCIHTSRGCPYICSFCCNNALAEIQGTRSIRKRSVESVMQELEVVTKKYPFIDFIFLTDEEIMSQKKGYLKEFSQEYKRRIDLPLKAEFNPSSFKTAKFEYLVDAGMTECHIGVQSGSDDTNKILYERRSPVKKTYKALDDILVHRDKLNVFYLHILICNDLECTESKKETLEFVANVDPFFNLSTFTLVYFPGVALTKAAMDHGLINKERYLEYLAYQNWSQDDQIYRMDYYTISIQIVARLKNRFGVSISFANMLTKILTSKMSLRILDTTVGRFAMKLVYCLMHRKFLKLIYLLLNGLKENRHGRYINDSSNLKDLQSSDASYAKVPINLELN